LAESVGFGIARQLLDEVRQGIKHDRQALEDGTDAKGNGQMGFPNTGGAEEQDILGMSDKAHGGEVPDLAFIDRGLKGKVKLIQGLVKGETGLAHFPANILLGAGGQFGLRERIKELKHRPAVGSGLLRQSIQV
jgi:hypothetical protein